METDLDINAREETKLEITLVGNGHAAVPTENSLHVLIVGCGITGLVAAISIKKKGFQVTIVEAATEFSHVGAGVRLSPNASRVLCRLGLREAMEQYSMPMENIKFYAHATGDLLVEEPQHDVETRFGAPFWQIHRADLHKVLLEKARESGMKFLMGQPVKEYDWERPSVLLGNGEVVEADVILAADGYRSYARSNLLQRKDEPRPSGESAFRFLVPCSELQSDPEVAKLTKDNTLHVWQALPYPAIQSSAMVGGGCHVVAYTIRQGHDLNIVCTQPSITVGSPATYLSPANPFTIQARYAGWDPRLTHILSRITAKSNALEWKLCDLPPMDTWVFPGGKGVLMGDACHAMLPSAGQGACMAVEDGCAIAELLGRTGPKARPEGKGADRVQAMKDGIPGMLKTFEMLRKDRCAMAAKGARENVKRWHAGKGEVKAGATSNWIWDYDIEEEARRCDILAD